MSNFLIITISLALALIVISLVLIFLAKSSLYKVYFSSGKVYFKEYNRPPAEIRAKDPFLAYEKFFLVEKKRSQGWTDSGTKIVVESTLGNKTYFSLDYYGEKKYYISQKKRIKRKFEQSKLRRQKKIAEKNKIKEQIRLEKVRFEQQKLLDRERVKEQKRLEKVRFEQQKLLDRERVKEQKRLEKVRFEEEERLEREMHAQVLNLTNLLKNLGVTEQVIIVKEALSHFPYSTFSEIHNLLNNEEEFSKALAEMNSGIEKEYLNSLLNVIGTQFSGSEFNSVIKPYLSDLMKRGNEHLEKTLRNEYNKGEYSKSRLISKTKSWAEIKDSFSKG